MLCDCLWAWFDERLKTQRTTMTCTTRLESACPILPDMEAKEIEPRFAFNLIKCMGNAGLAGFEFETERF
jgi:hypothetical protein